MLITLDPVAVNLGPLAVRWFGVLALLGLGMAIWRGLRAVDLARLPRKTALDVLAWGLPAGLVAARVVHVLGWWDYYLTHASELWQLNLDGLSLWGGLLGGGAIAFARLGASGNALRRRRVLDIAAPNLALGIAIGRLGAFVDGSGQGVPSDLPWATQYANRFASTPDFGVSRHPAQVYDGLVALALWAILSMLPRRWPAGSRIALFLVLYSSARLALGGVRLDPAFLFGLQIDQLLALVGLGFGLWSGLRAARIGAQRGPDTAGAGRGLTAARGWRNRTVSLPLNATLYVKAGCHLCESASSELARLQARYPHTLAVVDIDSDDDLVRRYWERIPVLVVDRREYDAPLTTAVLERVLAQGVANNERSVANPATATPSVASAVQNPAAAPHPPAPTAAAAHTPQGSTHSPPAAQTSTAGLRPAARVTQPVAPAAVAQDREVAFDSVAENRSTAANHTLARDGATPPDGTGAHPACADARQPLRAQGADVRQRSREPEEG